MMACSKCYFESSLPSIKKHIKTIRVGPPLAKLSGFAHEKTGKIHFGLSKIQKRFLINENLKVVSQSSMSTYDSSTHYT